MNICFSIITIIDSMLVTDYMLNTIIVEYLHIVYKIVKLYIDS